MKSYSVTLLNKDHELISADFVHAADLMFVFSGWASNKKVKYIEISVHHSDGYSDYLKFERKDAEQFFQIQKSRHYNVSDKLMCEQIMDRDF